VSGGASSTAAAIGWLMAIASSILIGAHSAATIAAVLPRPRRLARGAS